MFGDRVVTRPRRIVVAVTGASGAVYARLLLDALAGCAPRPETALIVSDNGRAVAAHEGVSLDAAAAGVKVYANNDMFAPPASGSAGYDSMVIVPCSMGTAGRIAAGVSTDLISRAADVMLKERRRLIVVPRETPLSAIHLRNLGTLADCGAVVVPASPSFYSMPDTMEQLCMTVIERVLSLLDTGYEGYRWEGR